MCTLPPANVMNCAKSGEQWTLTAVVEEINCTESVWSHAENSGPHRVRHTRSANDVKCVWAIELDTIGQHPNTAYKLRFYVQVMCCVCVWKKCIWKRTMFRMWVGGYSGQNDLFPLSVRSGGHFRIILHCGYLVVVCVHRISNPRPHVAENNNTSRHK